MSMKTNRGSNFKSMPSKRCVLSVIMTHKDSKSCRLAMTLCMDNMHFTVTINAKGVLSDSLCFVFQFPNSYARNTHNKDNTQTQTHAHKHACT